MIWLLRAGWSGLGFRDGPMAGLFLLLAGFPIIYIMSNTCVLFFSFPFLCLLIYLFGLI